MRPGRSGSTASRGASNRRSPLRFALEAVAHLLCACLGLALLVAAGQPIFTDDLWWHLAHGAAYLREGPWLEADPLLFTAEAPPAPASWLADVLLASFDGIGGFTALRILHGVLVVSILGTAWSLLRRVGASALVASLGTATFAAAAAYRLVQLRPHLFSILALLILYACLFVRTEAPSARRIAGVGVLGALWVNLHSAFVLGPLLVGVAAGIRGVESWLGVDRMGTRASDSASDGGWRTWLSGRGWLAWLAAGASITAGTLVNPVGPGAWAPYLRAGVSTPSLGRVGDEWTPIRLLEAPSWSAGPPSTFVWGLAWLLILLVVALITLDAIRIHRRQPARVGPLDLAFSALALAFCVLAVRFTWLVVLPLITLARAGSRSSSAANAAGIRRALGAALLSVVIVVGFFRVGDWRMITGYLPATLAGYAEPYPAAKYHAHAVWVMEDAGLTGNLFNEYYLGGFLGYWLAPEIRTFLNGSLNVSDAAMEANWPLRNRRGARPGETFLESLDRLGIDLFLGIRPPVRPPPGLPWRFSSGHLEDSPGWILGFRNLLGSLWIRDDEEGRRNLRRLAVYYRDQDVPFDPDRGFEPLRVIRDAAPWAHDRGVVPGDFTALLRAARDGAALDRDRALARIATVYSLLGEHAAAIEIDRPLLDRIPDARLVRRRLAWNLVHAGRPDEAVALTTGSEGRKHERSDPLLRRIGRVAERLPDLDAEERARRIATLPLLTEAESRGALTGLALPEARSHDDASPRRPAPSERSSASDGRRQGSSASKSSA